MGVVSEEVCKKLLEIEPQSLGILADARLACRDEVEQALRPHADRFIGALPRSLDAAALAVFSTLLNEMRIDNFGARGVRYVLEKMGVQPPEAAFRERAAEQICLSASAAAAASAGGDDGKALKVAQEALSGAALVHRRVFSYVEYVATVSSRGGAARPIDGFMSRENGRRNERRGEDIRTWPLKAVISPISGLVDRTLCSEFQLLCELIDIIRRAFGPVGSQVDMAAVRGQVRLFVSTAPCVSCLGAVHQFRLMLPSIVLEVANGEEAYLFVT